MHTSRRVAIVTGSPTGVGAATALALARRGYDVVINYSRSVAEARESEAACRAAGAPTVAGELLQLDGGLHLGGRPAQTAKP